MIANFPPYPGYKPSGGQWLGDVPSHWEVTQLGRIGRLFKGNGGSKEDETTAGVPCVRYGDIYTQHQYFVRESSGYIAEAKAADYTPLQYGDVLFAGSGETLEEIGKSAVSLIEGPARCGGDIVVFRPQIEVDPPFLGYAADYPYSAYQKACMGRGITVMHIYSDGLKHLTFPLPPLSEQAAIARYLDHVDRRINRYVRAKQRLIALIEEQKQAIIHHAVTRGLDPDVRLKPSGVEWLGDVPEHWEVRRAKQLMRPVDIRSQTGGEELLTVSSERGVVPRSTASVSMFEAESYVGHKLCWSDDLVINSLWAWARGLGVSPRHGIVSTAYGVYRCRQGSDLDPRFLHHLVRSDSFQWELQVRSKGVWKSRLQLTDAAFLDAPLPVPPLSEQAAIARYLDQATGTIERTIGRARREIELLGEYRTRLIADVVTGKLDVRKAATALPEVNPSDLEDIPEIDDVTVDEFAPELEEVDTWPPIRASLASNA